MSSKQNPFAPEAGEAEFNELDYVLLATPEGEYCDRKRQFHSNNAELLHDILCLANACASCDRFLIIGQADDQEIVGIEGDPNRKRNSDLIDMLKKSRLNRLPDVKLIDYEWNGHIISIIYVSNSHAKPYFATQDYLVGNTRVRAGVIYTRVGDTNTAIDGSGTDEQIELMWRERFALDIPPLSRLAILLKDESGWVKVVGDRYLYHRSHPEFVISDTEEDQDLFDEPWAKKFLNPSAHEYNYELRYHNTILARIPFVSCDGGRYQIPLPRTTSSGTYILFSESLGFRLAKILRQYFKGYQFVAELNRVGIGVEYGTDPSEEGIVLDLLNLF